MRTNYIQTINKYKSDVAKRNLAQCHENENKSISNFVLERSSNMRKNILNTPSNETSTKNIRDINCKLFHDRQNFILSHLIRIFS